MVDSTLYWKEGKCMKIRIQTQFQKSDDFSIKNMDQFYMVENDKNYSGEIVFTDRKSAVNYFQELIQNGFQTQDLYDDFRKVLVILEDAACFISGGSGEYVTAKDKATWVKIWIE